MFEKTEFRPIKNFKDVSNELLNVFLQDQMLGDYIRGAGQQVTPETCRGVMHHMRELFTNVNPQLWNHFNNLENMLYNLDQVNRSLNFDDPQNPSNNMAKTSWDQAVDQMNVINGYGQPQRGVNAPAQENTQRNAEESLDNQMHQYMAASDYAPVQDSPEGKLMLHMSNLASQCMLKMANFQRTMQMVGFVRDNNTSYQPDEHAEEVFFGKLKTEEREFVAMDDNTFDQRMDALEQKKEKYQAERDKLDAELNDMIDEDPNTRVYLEDEERIYAGEMGAGKDAFNSKLDKEMKELEESLKAEQTLAQQKYDEEKRQIAEGNEKITRQIQEIVTKKNERLKELEQTRESVEKQMRQEQEEALGGEKVDRETLEKRKKDLEDRVKAMGESLAAQEKIHDEKYRPAPEHFADVERQQHSLEWFFGLNNELKDISQKHGDPTLTDKAWKNAKEINSAREDLEKLEAARKKLEQQMENSGGERKKDGSFKRKDLKLMNSALKAQNELEKAQKEFDEKWGPQYEILQKLDGFRVDHPDDYKQIVGAYGKMNKPSMNECLDNLAGDCQVRIMDLKKPYDNYYRMVRLANVFGQDFTIDSFDEAQAELSKTDKMLDILDEKKFQEKLSERTQMLPTENEAKTLRQFEEKTMKDKVQELENKVVAREPDVKIPTDEEIRSRVDGERQKRTNERQNNLDKLVQDHMKMVKEEYYSTKRDEIRQNAGRMADKYEAGINQLNGVRREAKELHGKRVEAAEKVNRQREKWAEIKNDRSKYTDMLEDRINAMARDMDRGTKKGHTNSPKFEAMRTALEKAGRYMKENKKLLEDGNLAAKNGLQKMMRSIEKSAVEYKEAKAGGIHWISSNMRHVRLQFADDLIKFSKDSEKDIDAHYDNEVVQMNVSQQALKSKLKPVEAKPYQEFAKNGVEKSSPELAKENPQVKNPQLQNPQVQNPQMGVPQ